MAGICGGDYQAEEIVRLRRIETSETSAASMPIPSSSPMTFRRSGELSTSRPANGPTRGRRWSGPTCRSASDQASARPNDEGDGPPISARSSPDLWRYVAPLEITSGGFRASRRSGQALESAVRARPGRRRRDADGRSSCGGPGRPGPTMLVSVLGRAGTRL
jgi:hypothetical protein